MGLKQRGFTLLELLLAMILLSAIMSLGTMALNQFLNLAEKSGKSFDSKVAQNIALFNLVSVIEQADDYFYTQQGRQTLFFKGNSQHLSFVSNYALGNDGSPVFVSLWQEQAIEGNTLWLSYIPMSSNILLREQDVPELDGMRSLKILHGFKSLRFSYLGVNDIAPLILQGDATNYKQDLLWVAEYDAPVNILPLKIRLLVEWDDGTEWSLIIPPMAMNFAKRDYLDGL